MDRFVVGTGRCGSTLLSRMLATSPEMASLFEFFNGLPGDRRFAAGPVHGRDVWEIVSRPHPFVTMVTSRGHRVEEVCYPFGEPGKRYGADDDVPWLLVSMLPRLTDDPDRLFDESRDFLCAQPAMTLPEHYRAYFRWIARQCGKTMWNERSGSSIEYLAALASAFPEARVVHLHRAGAETSLSMREHAAFRLAISIVYGLDPEVDLATALSTVTPVPGRDDPVARMLARRPHAAHFGVFWSDQLATGYRGVAQLRPDQYVEVAFEDLVDRPAETMRRIAVFFEMDTERDGWIDRAAAMVRGRPPERAHELPAAERERLAEVCRAGNRLLGRPVPSRIEV